MMLEVLQPGPLSLLQDKGRFGFQDQGITTGGPMDEHAYAWGNWLLGNSEDATQVEITLGMAAFLFHQSIKFALTGADLSASLDGKPIFPWFTYQAQAGSTLKFGRPCSGMRTYLSVQGGFKVGPVLGSTSTVCREGIGGLDGQGKKLEQGDQLPLRANVNRSTNKVPRWAIPDYEKPIKLGVILGYQCELFSDSAKQAFFSTPFRISQHSDRMGFRLEGQEIAADDYDLVSEGVGFGSIQIPPDGQPIVLMKDRQTIGGYPKIGALSSLCAGQLSQRRPGTKVFFTPMSLAQAESDLRLFRQVVSRR
ncbi:biotin-dependent carboxyltransferase family protein [Veronia pacifica]|uniref:Allophanate hydrolase n=1 Tax=Veronia pacifica TaxID=1080227 RepID=A0A1C3EQS5_9GAMM|nr:biotin-dependent carboxyltransferase family protein [Veronia pacifica]ODA35590.1 allophanate hydrolase [Veronia pacifica]